MTLCLPAVAAGTAPTSTVSVDAPATAAPGETVTATIRIDAESSVYAAEFELSYPSAGAATQATPGGFLSANASTFVVANRVNESAGRVSFGESRRDTQTGVTGEGVLAEVDVTVPTDASGTVALSLPSVKLAAPNGSAVPVAVENATVDVETDGAPTATATGPSDAPAGTPATVTPTPSDGVIRATATRSAPGTVSVSATGGGTVVASLPETEVGDRTGVRLTDLTVRSVSADRFDATVRAVSPDAAGFEGPEPPVLAAYNISHSVSGGEYGPVRFRFTVSDERLLEVGAGPEGTGLYRLTGDGWTRLPTTTVESTDAGYVFAARSPGLSTFAVAAEPGAKTTAVASLTPSPSPSATPTAVPPGTTAESPSDAIGPGLGAVAALVALAVVALGAGRR